MLLETEINFDVSWAVIIQALLALILPLVVGLVTSKMTPSAAKALLLAGLNIISTGLTELLASLNGGEDFDLGNWLVSAIASFAISAASYYGLWKPTGAAPTLQRVGSREAHADGSPQE